MYFIKYVYMLRRNAATRKYEPESAEKLARPGEKRVTVIFPKNCRNSVARLKDRQGVPD
jgi:hypothetical protein